MPIARLASVPVRARLPRVRVWREGVVRGEAVAPWERPRWDAGDGAWDEAGAGLGASVGEADGSALGAGAGSSPPLRVSPMSSGLWSEER